LFPVTGLVLGGLNLLAPPACVFSAPLILGCEDLMLVPTFFSPSSNFPHKSQVVLAVKSQSMNTFFPPGMDLRRDRKVSTPTNKRDYGSRRTCRFS